MSYTQFSTDNADYYLVYAHHKEWGIINEEIFQKPKIDSLDAIILESGEMEYKNRASYHPFYSELRNNAEESKKNTKIYLVDVHLTSPEFSKSAYFLKKSVHLLVGGGLALSAAFDFKKRTNRRKFLKGGLKVLASFGIFSSFAGLHINSNIEGEAIPVVSEIESFLGYMPPLPGIELRNAIAARKIEEYIVPELWRDLGRKPLIAIVYGGGHVGIETDLKYKGMRDSVIKTYDALGYVGIKTEDLNYVYEIDVKNNTGKRIKVNLF